MKLVSDLPSRQLYVVKSTGDEIAWSSSEYTQTRFKGIEDPFRELNRYIATRTVKQREELFTYYLEAKEALDRVNHPTKLRDELRRIAAGIFGIVTYRDVELWAVTNVVYDVPKTLSVTHDHPDHPIEGTYLLGDYHEMILMSIIFSAMLPIWAEYLGKVSQTMGSVNKELGCYHLLLDIPDILNMKPMNKLRMYVDHFCSDKGRVAEATLEGLTIDQIPEWLFSILIVRRMAIGEIDASLKNPNGLVAVAYMTMTSLMEELRRKFKAFKTGVKDRDFNLNANQENSLSIAEVINVQQDITLGQLTRFELAIEDSYTLAAFLEPEIDEAKLNACIEHSLDRAHVHQVDFHVGVSALVVKEAIHPNVIRRLENYNFMILQGIVQAILWHRGHIELAVQLTATPMALATEGVSLLSEGKTRISATTATELIKYYPHAFPDHGDNESHYRRNNIATNSARLMANSLETTYYKVECPDELWSESKQFNEHRNIQLDTELLEKVSALLIDQAKRGA